MMGLEITSESNRKCLSGGWTFAIIIIIIVRIIATTTHLLLILRFILPDFMSESLLFVKLATAATYVLTVGTASRQ